MSYRFADSLRAGSGWNCSSILILVRHEPTLNMSDNALCRQQILSSLIKIFSFGCESHEGTDTTFSLCVRFMYFGASSMCCRLREEMHTANATCSCGVVCYCYISLVDNCIQYYVPDLYNQSPATHRGDSGLFPAVSMRNSWWTK